VKVMKCPKSKAPEWKHSNLYYQPLHDCGIYSLLTSKLSTSKKKVFILSSELLNLNLSLNCNLCCLMNGPILAINTNKQGKYIALLNCND
jgi:hypothetical protein